AGQHAKPSAPTPPPAAAAPEATLESLRERVQASDPEAALAQLDKLIAQAPQLASQNEFRYLRARLYEQLERFDEALKSLPEDNAELPDLVARDVRKRRALWLARTGHCTEARPLLAQVVRTDAADTELKLRSADCAVAQGDTNGALALLRDPHGATHARFAMRRAAANVLLTTGDTAGAVRELRALYVEYPTEPESPALYDQLRAQVRGFRLTNDEFMARAERWLTAARPDPAWVDLNQVKFTTPRDKRERREQQADRARLTHLKGMALFRMRTRYAEAAKVLKQASNMESSTQAEDAFHAAQAVARADRNADAVRAFKAFVQRFPRDRNAAEADQRAAWLELRHNLPGGEKHMRALLERAERTGNKSTQAELLWELALYNFAHKHCDRALPLFERYATTSGDAMVKARGIYWAGRCAAVLGDRERALTLYKNALAVEPLHWYALLARARITALGADPGPPFPAPRSDDPGGDGVAVSVEPVALALPPAATFYAKVGLQQEAVQALRAREKELREGPKDRSLLRLISAYHGLGEYARPYALAERESDAALSAAPTPQVRPLWNALFPKPYPQEMSAATASIAPELVYAVMRKESAFNPRVVSNADAIGLLQLIELTAGKCAEELGMPHFERKQLYDPSTNIKLGAHYLTKLVTRYRGQAVPAIAAYNAGEHRVDPWLDRMARGRDRTVELDWFVEDIPFDQTRNYVKRVVSSWAHYVYLYQRQDGAWPLDLALTFKR
ncbi:MAG: hypothetical protein RL701_1590, partial [Pseudomonadota bacterium]